MNNAITDNDSEKHLDKRQKIGCEAVKIIELQPESAEIQCDVTLDDNLLNGLISPFDKDEFLNECFRSRAVHIPDFARNGGRIGAIRDYLYDFDPIQIFQHTSSESIFVWLQLPEKRIHSIEVSDPDAALALYKAGNATYCRAPPHVEQLLVPALLRETGLGLGQYDPTGQSMACLGRGEVEVFLSTPGHVTDWHFDFQENFTVNLTGVKKWTLQNSTIKHPLRGCTPHYNNTDDVVESQLKAARLADPNFSFGKPEIGKNAVGEISTVILKPGDVLYHPAGIWHKVEVMEPGVSINVSLMATTIAEITCQSLQHFLMKRNEWRQCVQSGGASIVDTVNSMLKSLPDLVKEFQQTVGAESILPPALRNGTLGGTQSDDFLEGDKMSDAESSAQDEHENRDGIVDADSFALPDGDVLACQQSGMKLNVNPLAVLLEETDLYSEKEGENSDGDESKICVLNVNYAGIENHESSLRVQLASRNWEKLRNFLDKKEHGTVPVKLCPLVACLVYYGYLHWGGK